MIMAERRNYLNFLVLVIVKTALLNFGHFIFNFIPKDEFIPMHVGDLARLNNDGYIIQFLNRIADDLDIQGEPTFNIRFRSEHVKRIQFTGSNFGAMLNLFQLFHSLFMHWQIHLVNFQIVVLCNSVDKNLVLFSRFGETDINYLLFGMVRFVDGRC